MSKVGVEMKGSFGKSRWGSYAVSVAVGGVIGAAATFFLLSMVGALSSDSTSGNAADWWAAAGTWVIGIGATFFAFESRKQTQNAERARRSSRQMRFVFGLAHAKTMPGIADEFLQQPATKRSWAMYHEVLDVLGAYAHEINVDPDAGEYIPHEAIGNMVIVNETLRLIRNFVMEEKANLPAVGADRDALISDEALARFNEMRVRLDGMIERCDSAKALVQARLANDL